MGYTLLDRVRISTAIFEIARDFVVYAEQGEIVISWREDEPTRKGLTFFCHDCGQNSPKLTSKFQTGGQNSQNRLNFLSLRKLVDEFEFKKDAVSPMNPAASLTVIGLLIPIPPLPT